MTLGAALVGVPPTQVASADGRLSAPSVALIDVWLGAMGNSRSRLYYGSTRTKVIGTVARLMEMMFPQTEKNWGIRPSPIPDLSQEDTQSVLDTLQNGLPEGTELPSEVIERAIADTVAEWGIVAAGRRDAPGVYVDGRKLASIGLRIRRGHSYHGLALNVALDLEPFRRINPCGYAGLEMTQLADLGGPSDLRIVAAALAPRLLAGVGLDPQSATSTRWQELRSR